MKNTSFKTVSTKPKEIESNGSKHQTGQEMIHSIEIKMMIKNNNSFPTL